MRSQLTDGTWVEEDASGNVTPTSGPNGDPVLIDTSIVNSFLRDAFGSISAAIRRDYALAPATPATPAAPAAASALLTPQVKTLLLFGLGFLVVKKFLL